MVFSKNGSIKVYLDDESVVPCVFLDGKDAKIKIEPLDDYKNYYHYLDPISEAYNSQAKLKKLKKCIKEEQAANVKYIKQLQDKHADLDRLYQTESCRTMKVIGITLGSIRDVLFNNANAQKILEMLKQVVNKAIAFKNSTLNG